MDLVTIKERIYNKIVEKGKVYRKSLAEELNVAPRNLNRDIDKLINEDLIVKDKDGKEIYYFPKIIDQQEEPISIIPEIIEPEISMPTSQKIFKIIRKSRITKGQKIVDYLEEQGCEVPCKELRKIFNISSRNFSANIRIEMEKGKVLRRKDKRETYYRHNSSPIRTIEHRTNLEISTAQITELIAFLDYLRNRNYSDLTIQEYARQITYFYKWKDDFNPIRFTVHRAEKFSIRDIDAFIKHLRENRNYTNAAIRNVLVALKSYFKYLKRNNYILNNFLEDEPFPEQIEKEQPTITMEDFWEFIKLAKESKYKERDIALLLLMLDAGPRVSEIETICREHIDFQEKIITILGAKKKRIGGKRIPRSFPLSDLTLRYLSILIETNGTIEPANYLAQNKIERIGTAIFLNEIGTQMKNRQIRNFINDLRHKLHMRKRVTVHSVRRYLSTFLTNNGMREDFVSVRLGQTPKNVSQITLLYMKMSPEYREEYNRQYQLAHPLNQPAFIAKFNAIVEANQ